MAPDASRRPGTCSMTSGLSPHHQNASRIIAVVFSPQEKRAHPDGRHQRTRREPADTAELAADEVVCRRRGQIAPRIGEFPAQRAPDPLRTVFVTTACSACTLLIRAIVELSDLPIGLSETASVRKAIGVYCNELKLLKEMDPPSTAEEDVAFTEAIEKAKDRGTNLVPLICGGLNEIKRTDLGSNALQLVSVQEDIQHRLDTFFLSRVGIRMLIGQHVESLDKAGGRVELVNVEETVRNACERAAKLCIKYCGQAPEFEIRSAATAPAPFIYVESHLHHMVFEIVKNSMRATVEYHRGLQTKKPGPMNRLKQVMNPDSKSLGFVLPSSEDVQGVTIYPDVGKYRRPGELPPIQIVICQGQEDVTIKVSDEGGGVPRSNWSKLWHYDYTTSPPYPPRESSGFHSFRQQFSGGGYGLPIARLFARYFGGEVTFISLEGSGSSAFIQAHRLGTKAEVVPGHATFSLQPLYS